MGGALKPTDAGEAIIAALMARRSIPDRVMIVAAHPDDETLGVGAQLCRFRDALIVHVTDGAPRNGRDAIRHGFANAADYATARRAELTNALLAGDASGARTVGLGIPDQEACRDLADLTRRIVELLDSERPRAVITHAYEGGHPDHDAVAFAVHAACRLAPRESTPAILEMALYHHGRIGLVRGDFLPADRPATVISLDQAETRRKQDMFDCFTTQRWLLAEFPLESERLRPAPNYDFRAAPHRGTLHYMTLGWCMTGVKWRRAAAAALSELDLADRPCL
jgi:LmbE family N-acetylglucosaminyl deacetylase